MSHIHDLPKAVIGLETGDELFVRVDPPRNSHFTLAWNFPETIFDPVQSNLVYHTMPRLGASDIGLPSIQQPTNSGRKSGIRPSFRRRSAIGGRSSIPLTHQR